MCYAGVATLMTAVRSEFWVVGLRAIARRVVRGCMACRRQDAPGCSEQTAPLPKDRATRAPPFAVTRSGLRWSSVYGRLSSKEAMHMLFTCAVTRAVHLELTESLSMEHFAITFCRFAARRGVPSTVYSISDYARNFVAAEVLLRSTSGDWRLAGTLSVHSLRGGVVGGSAWCDPSRRRCARRSGSVV